MTCTVGVAAQSGYAGSGPGSRARPAGWWPRSQRAGCGLSTRGRSRRRLCVLHRSGRGVRLRRARGRRIVRGGLRTAPARPPAADEQGVSAARKTATGSRALEHLTSKWYAGARRLARPVADTPAETADRVCGGRGPSAAGPLTRCGEAQTDGGDSDHESTAHTHAPARATSQPVAPVTQAPTPTRVSAPPARTTVQATQPTVHHKARAALAKSAARPHKPPVKKALPKIGTKKPVVKVSRSRRAGRRSRFRSRRQLRRPLFRRRSPRTEVSCGR